MELHTDSKLLIDCRSHLQLLVKWNKDFVFQQCPSLWKEIYSINPIKWRLSQILLFFILPNLWPLSPFFLFSFYRSLEDTEGPEYKGCGIKPLCLRPLDPYPVVWGSDGGRLDSPERVSHLTKPYKSYDISNKQCATIQIIRFGTVEKHRYISPHLYFITFCPGVWFVITKHPFLLVPIISIKQFTCENIEKYSPLGRCDTFDMSCG